MSPKNQHLSIGNLAPDDSTSNDELEEQASLGNSPSYCGEQQINSWEDALNPWPPDGIHRPDADESAIILQFDGNEEQEECKSSPKLQVHAEVDAENEKGEDSAVDSHHTSEQPFDSSSSSTSVERTRRLSLQADTEVGPVLDAYCGDHACDTNRRHTDSNVLSSATAPRAQKLSLQAPQRELDSARDGKLLIERERPIGSGSIRCRPDLRHHFCDIRECRAAFKRLSDLRRHKNHVHRLGRKLYKCNRCNYSQWTRYDKVKEHCKKNHGGRSLVIEGLGTTATLSLSHFCIRQSSMQVSR